MPAINIKQIFVHNDLCGMVHFEEDETRPPPTKFFYRHYSLCQIL